MKASCGDVLYKETKPYVITEMIEGVITETERLEDVVAKQVTVQYEGQQRTLFGLLHEKMAEYLYHTEIVKSEEQWFSKPDNERSDTNSKTCETNADTKIRKPLTGN